MTENVIPLTSRLEINSEKVETNRHSIKKSQK